MKPSTQLLAGITKIAKTSTTMTTTWTFLSQVIPNLPLCFSNYARSGAKYGVVQVNLIVQA